jgi:PAS domain S-box-containing protein
MARKVEPEALSVPSEDQLRLIIDTVPVMVWTARPDGSRDFVNERWIEYTGLRPEAALGKSFAAAHPEDRKEFIAQWEQAIEAGTPMEREMRLRRGDGKYFWTIHRIAPLRDGSEKVVKWFATITDIDALTRKDTGTPILVPVK